MRNLYIVLAATAASAHLAYADGEGSGQSADTGTNNPAAAAVNPISIVQGNGVKVGESTTVLPIVGVETGFVSNVFYQDTGVVSAGLLRVLGEMGVGSLPQQRLGEENPP